MREGAVMEWLLVFVWLSGRSTAALTTEKFDTEAECRAAGAILEEAADIPLTADYTRWDCHDISAKAAPPQ
jgi:hypothetical protein